MAAQHDERRTVSLERLVEPVVVMEEDRPLQLQPRAGQPVQRGACRVDLAKGAARVARVEQGAAEAHPRLGRPHPQVGSGRDSHGAPQMDDGRIAVPQPQCGEPESAFGHRDRLDVVPRTPQCRLCERPRAPGRVRGELDRPLGVGEGGFVSKVEVGRLGPHYARA